MNQILHYIGWIWMGCSAFNLVVFLIFLHDYKILTEKAMSRGKGKEIVISTNEFIPWVCGAALVLGPIATFSILRNIITVGKPFDIEDDKNENLHT